MRTPFDTAPRPALVGMTGPQRGYLFDLLTQKAEIKGMDPVAAEAATNKWLDEGGFDKSKASELIDRAKADNARLRALFKPLEADAKRPVQVSGLDDGLYVRHSDGAVFKLYHTVHGRNELVAKELVIVKGEPDPYAAIPLPADKGTFEYRGKAPLRSLEGDKARRLTLDEARAFGAIYGQCCRCLAPLTHEISIALGIGPKCGEHEYADEFKPLYDAAKAQLKVSA